MTFNLRPARPGDLDRLMEIFETARRFMASTGNPNQWIDGYPGRRLMADEISAGHCHVCCTDEGRVVGTFCFILGDDPTYARIEQGAWLSDRPYGVIHRLASDGTVHGVTGACIDWCAQQTDCLRADTHADNRVMQHLLLKHGFSYCGIIYVANGTPRRAYQRGR